MLLYVYYFCGFELLNGSKNFLVMVYFNRPISSRILFSVLSGRPAKSKRGKNRNPRKHKFQNRGKIDNKKQRIAKLQGITITLKLNAVALPEEALKYIIAHEIAHTYIKRHTQKFWQIVEAICPNYKYAKENLENDKSLMLLKFNC
jgi:hypothetical protein